MAKPISAMTKALQSQVSKYSKGMTTGMTKLLASQEKKQEGLFKQYETKSAGQEKMADAYTRLSGEAGLPDVQKQLDIYKGNIYQIQGLLDELDKNVTERTTGTLTSEAQRQRQIAYEATPLQANLAKLGTAAAPLREQLTSTQQTIATQLGLQSQDQLKELQPLIMRIDATSDRFSREITGYTTSKQNELSIMLEKLQRSQALDDAEWKRVTALAAEEREFARQKQLIAINAANSAKKETASTKSKTTASFKAAVAKPSGFKVAIHGEERSTPRPGEVGYITREDFIKRLSLQFPSIDKNDIAQYVYQYYSG